MLKKRKNIRLLKQHTIIQNQVTASLQSLNKQKKVRKQFLLIISKLTLILFKKRSKLLMPKCQFNLVIISKSNSKPQVLIRSQILIRTKATALKKCSSFLRKRLIRIWIRVLTNGGEVLETKAKQKSRFLTLRWLVNKI